MRGRHGLIVLEVQAFLVHAILVDDPDVHVVARADVSLTGGRESIFHDVHHLRARARGAGQARVHPTVQATPRNGRTWSRGRLT